MIPVFLSHMDTEHWGTWNPERSALFEAVWARWEAIGIQPLVIGLSQRDRHSYALREARAVGAAWFISCDDDILLSPYADGRRVLDYVSDALSRNTAYSMLQPVIWPCVAIPRHDPEVTPAAAVGGIRFVRTDAYDPDALPPCPADGKYDFTLTSALKGLGGVLQRVHAVHCGWRGKFASEV